MTRTGVIWLSMGTIERLLWTLWWTFLVP